MSAHRTAEAALTVAEDALRRVRIVETGESHILITLGVLISLVLVYYVQTQNKESLDILQALLNHRWVRNITISLIILGLSGLLGRSFQIFANVIGFTLLFCLLILPPAKKEGYASLPISVAEPTCGKVPKAVRPETKLLGLSDELPPTGVDMLSSPPGVYTDSGIAYEMNMS